MPRVILPGRLRIDECSAVDKAANPYVKVMLIKRDSGEPVPQTREQALQAAADRYTSTLAKSTQPVTEYQAYRKRLFEAGPRTEPEPAPVVVNKSFARLQSMAKRAAAKDPALSVEQHFAKLAEANPALMAKAIRITLEECDDPDDDETDDADDDAYDEDDDEMVKAKRPKAANRRREGKTNVNPQDEDDLDDADVSLDPTPANDPGRGMPAPTAAEAKTNRGRSDAPYNDQGDNLRQNPKPAVWGRTEGSYDPTRRGSANRPNGPGVTTTQGRLDKRLVEGSAERVRLEKVQRRVAKYLATNPTASRVEAHRYAEMGKKQRRAYNGALAR